MADSETKYEKLRQSMYETYTALTGFSPDDASDVGIRIQALAGELEKLWDQLERLEKAVFPQTGEGVYLERHAQTRGLERKGGIQAKGRLRFGRETPATQDLPIPEGVVCATYGEPMLRFITTQGGILPAGEQWVDIPAQAVEIGQNANVAAGAVKVMITPVPQIQTVANSLPFAGGMEEEGDVALRGRLLESYRVVSNGTNGAAYLQKALEYDGVTSARVMPRKRGIGTVDIALTCAGADLEASLLEQMKKEMDAWREINVDLALYAARKKQVAIQVEIQEEAGLAFAPLQERLSALLSQAMAACPVGEPLRLAQLYRLIMEVAGVQNCHILSPTADVAVAENEVAVLESLQITQKGGV